ncbi:transporter substrate-binding domain-containing protein [Legionella fallonii]|uniref:Peb1 (Arginine binding periplasmic protein) n=1 Tax=Legionella fallonii LLAP-10 TaxID=1212491 RepID=A0A098G2E5_9GAMM|nr:transporter substrate-binding domain-containing protein [Legionella fallonii]CEG56154.1 Peb1 (Arginine binding periplasmic protein) [Legionella fallonii LLAP-10]
MKLIVLIILLVSNVLAYGDKLKVGVLQFAPPFSSKSDTSNHYYGFVIELMNTVCKRLQAECEYVAIPKQGELSGLDQGIFDITFTPKPITSFLPDSYLYSLPYLPSHGQFLTLKTNSIKTPEDINNKRVGFYKINFQEAPILSKYSNMNTFIEFTDPAELISALMNKKIDVILINHYAARYIVTTVGRSTDSNLMLVGDKIPIGSGYGIISLKSNAPLIDKINHTLLDMEKDGTYSKIYNEYFGYNPSFTHTEH